MAFRKRHSSVNSIGPALNVTPVCAGSWRNMGQSSFEAFEEAQTWKVVIYKNEKVKST